MKTTDMTTEEQRAKWREYYHRKHPVKPSRTFFHPKMNRLVTRQHYSTSIFWSEQMLAYLKDNFATSLNDDLSDWLGVSVRTMLRKARELGLSKDTAWLSSVWKERRLMAHAASKAKGYPGAFRKGQHASPETEFKKRTVINN